MLPETYRRYDPRLLHVSLLAAAATLVSQSKPIHTTPSHTYTPGAAHRKQQGEQRLSRAADQEQSI